MSGWSGTRGHAPSWIDALLFTTIGWIGGQWIAIGGDTDATSTAAAPVATLPAALVMPHEVTGCAALGIDAPATRSVAIDTTPLTPLPGPVRSRVVGLGLDQLPVFSGRWQPAPVVPVPPSGAQAPAIDAEGPADAGSADLAAVAPAEPTPPNRAPAAVPMVEIERHAPAVSLAALDRIRAALAAGDHVRALELLGTLGGAESATRARLRATAWVMSGDVAHLPAMAALELRHRDDPGLRALLARMQLLAGRHESALATLVRSLPALEAHPDYYELLGATLVANAQYASAARVYRTLLAAGPGGAHVWRGLAQALRGTGDQAGALAAQQRANRVSNGMTSLTAQRVVPASLQDRG